MAIEPLLHAEDARDPEFNQFTVEMCRGGRLHPHVYKGDREESIWAAASQRTDL